MTDACCCDWNMLLSSSSSCCCCCCRRPRSRKPQASQAYDTDVIQRMFHVVHYTRWVTWQLAFAGSPGSLHLLGHLAACICWITWQLAFAGSPGSLHMNKGTCWRQAGHSTGSCEMCQWQQAPALAAKPQCALMLNRAYSTRAGVGSACPFVCVCLVCLYFAVCMCECVCVYACVRLTRVPFAFVVHKLSSLVLCASVRACGHVHACMWATHAPWVVRLPLQAD